MALGVDVKEFTKLTDSISFCLSKGLSSPVGSVICGSSDFIKEARRIRKVVGGGMRQAGILAAAGIVSLEQMTDRLAEDHKNAKVLAEGIAQIKGLSIDLSRVHTNIVYFNLNSDKITPEKFHASLEEKGIRCLSTAKSTFRMVTHYGIETEDIETALSTLRQTMKHP